MIKCKICGAIIQEGKSYKQIRRRIVGLNKLPKKSFNLCNSCFSSFKFKPIDKKEME